LAKDKAKEGHSKLSLNRLAEGKCPCITKGQGRYLAEAASVCIDDQGHALVSKLGVLGDHDKVFDLRRLAVQDQMSRALADLKEATEFGAEALAILLVQELTEFQAVLRAVTMTGVDYWLADKDDADLALSGRLEVSGTLAGGEAERKKRVREKLKQTSQSDSRGIPAMVVVVEFGDLIAEVVKKR
jgi:hypothetical protein